MAYSGHFKPKNPQKYCGNINNIIFRSLWELRLFKFLDGHPNVLSWGSEETVVPYKSPIDGKFHRYFVDASVKMIDKDGVTKKFLIEVKPFSQTIEPQAPKKITKAYKNKVWTYLINKAKWEAASSLAKHNGGEFIILTEHELFGRPKTV